MLRQRIRVRFSKRGTLRFISHLALMRAFERALRRAGLPLRMTQGFNPHPRISFPFPLGVGTEASDEVMEFELEGWTPPDEVEQRLRGAVPPGVEVRSTEAIPPNETGQAVEATYVVRPTNPASPESRIDPARAKALLNQDEILAQRQRKGRMRTVNIRPYLLDLRVTDGVMTLRLSVAQGATSRPEEVLAALGLPDDRLHQLFHMERTRVVLARPRPEGRPKPAATQGRA